MDISLFNIMEPTINNLHCCQKPFTKCHGSPWCHDTAITNVISGMNNPYFSNAFDFDITSLYNMMNNNTIDESPAALGWSWEDYQKFIYEDEDIILNDNENILPDSQRIEAPLESKSHLVELSLNPTSFLKSVSDGKKLYVLDNETELQSALNMLANMRDIQCENSLVKDREPCLQTESNNFITILSNGDNQCDNSVMEDTETYLQTESNNFKTILRNEDDQCDNSVVEDSESNLQSDSNEFTLDLSDEESDSVEMSIPEENIIWLSDNL